MGAWMGATDKFEVYVALNSITVISKAVVG